MYDDELADSFGDEVEAELVNMCGDYKQPIVKQNVGHPELDLANATRDADDVLKNAMKMVGSFVEEILEDVQKIEQGIALMSTQDSTN
ncbi:zinc finger BED domain-containing protein RICESLEEPER 2-like [Salvia divinorum]|uniref:Zinc finger BED domain-containing protein RICESLEEPER 2-like n=1 Tax=Salvia divinorum TaxID=28513 RepID=A0ABD1GM55_SALDI